MSLSTRRLAIVGLVALLPVGAYAVLRGDAFAAVAALNVLLIVGSFHLMLNGPAGAIAGGTPPTPGR